MKDPSSTNQSFIDRVEITPKKRLKQQRKSRLQLIYQQRLKRLKRRRSRQLQINIDISMNTIMIESQDRDEQGRKRGISEKGKREKDYVLLSKPQIGRAHV